jgi:hypothetical protein
MPQTHRLLPAPCVAPVAVVEVDPLRTVESI